MSFIMGEGFWVARICMQFFAWIISKWSSLKKYAMVGRFKGREGPSNGAQSPYGAIFFYGVVGPLVAIGWTLKKLKIHLATYSIM